MKGQKRIRDYGIIIGELNPGEKNAITDVKGVKVGHVTLDNGSVKTGVTAILPHEGNIFKDKVIAASHVINGFGKTTGTIQIEELGTIETPIILTNTLSVGLASDALIEYMLKENEDIGVTTGTVNPVVCECNDGYLNDIRGRHVKKEHVFEAIQNADVEFEEGAVGAGTGMSCYGLKGGIGSASRQIELNSEIYTVGILVLSNFGKKENLIVNGVRVGKMISERDKVKHNESDKGSIIIILATDIPMTSRQLKRISRRAVIGLSRTGSYMGNGSGEIVIGFTTSNRVNHYEKETMINIKMFNENKIDVVFRAVAEATEEAILNSLICADTTKGRDGHIRYSLKEYIDLI
ncbi:P1 family peptidase [Caloranaerobacter sp. DY30410]|uniref:DmpA family aminopeptidase n=1 Tax=Caloranaerobacter sp. DY30410 TaxID=3238305 RepID=UPI003D005972